MAFDCCQPLAAYGLLVLDAEAEMNADPLDDQGFLVLEGVLVRRLTRLNAVTRRSVVSEVPRIIDAARAERFTTAAIDKALADLDEQLARFSTNVVPRAARTVERAQQNMGALTKESTARVYQTETIAQNALFTPAAKAAESVQVAAPAPQPAPPAPPRSKPPSAEQVQPLPARQPVRFSNTATYSWTAEQTRWTTQDQIAMRALSDHQSLFMAQHFDQTLRDKARNIVARDYSLFADRPDLLAKRLKEGLVSMVEATDAYWQVVATTALNNARSYASLRWFSQNGIVAYQIEATLDSRTSAICRGLHGRVFPVAPAMESMDRMMQATSLDELDQISPMVRPNPAGGFQIGRGTPRFRFDAESALNISTPDLIDQGVMFPPFHFLCRSRIRPVFGDVRQVFAANNIIQFLPQEYRNAA